MSLGFLKPIYGIIDTMETRDIHPDTAFSDSIWKSERLLTLFYILVSIELILVLLDVTVNWWQWSDASPIRRLFNITREDGLATFFSVFQTLAIGCVLWMIYLLVRFQETSSVKKTGFLTLACIFTFMAIDDAAMVHERIGTSFKNSNEHIDFISFGWQYIVAPVYAVLGAFILVFVWNLANDLSRKIVLIAALGCLSLAVAIDFVEGLENGYKYVVEIMDSDQETIRHFSKSIEEFLEMLGMTLFLLLFLDHLGRRSAITEIRISNGKLKLVDVVEK